MGDVVELFPHKSVKEDNSKAKAAARSYKQWRLVNAKQYEKFRDELLKSIDDDDNVGTVLITLDAEGRTTVQCDICESTATDQLHIAVALLNKEKA